MGRINQHSQPINKYQLESRSSSSSLHPVIDPSSSLARYHAVISSCIFIIAVTPPL